VIIMKFRETMAPNLIQILHNCLPQRAPSPTRGSAGCLAITELLSGGRAVQGPTPPRSRVASRFSALEGSSLPSASNDPLRDEVDTPAGGSDSAH
jgi:hypothetical protein